jgi:hypothetical protein
VKGQSGNPLGRRKSHGDRLKEALEAQFEPEVMAEKLDKFIAAGSEKCLLHYFDRVLGKPAQSITVSGDAERPLHALVGVVARDLTAPAPQDAPAALPAGEAHCLDDLDGA